MTNPTTVIPILGTVDSSSTHMWKMLDQFVLPSIKIDSGPNVFYKCWEMRKHYDWHPETYFICNRLQDGQIIARPPSERLVRDIPKFYITNTRSHWNDIYKHNPGYELNIVRQIVGASTDFGKIKIQVPGVFT